MALMADADDDSPGIALTINGALAAVVEWNSANQSLVIRTYNHHDEEPQSYHRWKRYRPRTIVNAERGGGRYQAIRHP